MSLYLCLSGCPSASGSCHKTHAQHMHSTVPSSWLAETHQLLANRILSWGRIDTAQETCAIMFDTISRPCGPVCRASSLTCPAFGRPGQGGASCTALTVRGFAGGHPSSGLICWWRYQQLASAARSLLVVSVRPQLGTSGNFFVVTDFPG